MMRVKGRDTAPLTYQNQLNGADMTAIILTQQYLKTILNYEPETGIFTWLPRHRDHFGCDGSFRSWNSRFAGVRAGGVRSDEGTRHITIRAKDGAVKCSARRLAFLWMTGSLPSHAAGNFNGERDDNRWSNLMSSGRQEYGIAGEKHGRLLVVDRAGTYKSRILWNCKCDCGGTTTATTTALRAGVKRSCGCLYTGSPTHGLTGTRAYKTWQSMISRCHNTHDTAYCNYGGRGITVCARWRNDLAAFHKDMGDPPKGMSIDREDNNSGYSKENCRWATQSEQSRNTRRSKRWFIDGLEFDSCVDAAKHFGVTHQSVIAWCARASKKNCFSVLKYES